MSYVLEENDPEILGFINQELERQNTHLEMIASENFTFPSVMEAMGSVLTNKYAEGYPYKRYYGGCEFVDKIEELAINRAKKLFDCAFANVQPHAGSQANCAVYSALLKPYDKILGMDLSHGGHLTHGAKVSLTGQIYQSFFYGVELDGRINYDKVAETARIVKPNMIVCGFSAYSRKLDFARFKEIAESVGAILMADIAHVAGLVVAGEYPNPFPYADAYSFHSGFRFSPKPTALPAITCISGPPCIPGKTALSIFLAYSSLLVKINPPRGPRKVLCVVVVTTSA